MAMASAPLVGPRPTAGLYSESSVAIIWYSDMLYLAVQMYLPIAKSVGTGLKVSCCGICVVVRYAPPYLSTGRGMRAAIRVAIQNTPALVISYIMYEEMPDSYSSSRPTRQKCGQTRLFCSLVLTNPDVCSPLLPYGQMEQRGAAAFYSFVTKLAE